MARFKLRPLFRRSKTASTISSEPDSTATTIAASSSSLSPSPSAQTPSPRPQQSRSSLRKLRDPEIPDPVPEQRESILFSQTAESTLAPSLADLSFVSSVGQDFEKLEREDSAKTHDAAVTDTIKPALVLQHPTPPTTLLSSHTHKQYIPDTAPESALSPVDLSAESLPIPVRPKSRESCSSNASPKHISRPQSIADGANVNIVTLTNMPRKIWVRRPGASATLVQVREDDLVDDVREMILRKYANSLGRTFDAPDMTLRIASRAEHGSARPERVLGPEEDICRTIDSAFPGGQTVDDALIIDVPSRRTPKASPRAYPYAQYPSMEEHRPMESGTDYFPPMPATIQPVLNGPPASHTGGHHPSLAPADHPRSISVLSTGQVPPLPSPGAVSRRHRDHRPKFARQHTSSPTIVQHNTTTGAVTTINPPTLNPGQIHLAHRVSARPRLDSTTSVESHTHNGVPPAPSLPTPPAPDVPPVAKAFASTPPTPSTAAAASLHLSRPPRPRKARKTTPERADNRARRERRASAEGPPLALPISSMLDGTVPPINVLIVEDNHINLRVLEGLMKRLRVRWSTAMNGKIAVDKWRAGGFHLILMDIQMPIMNGLQATKEIRRLEKVNGIGVFSSSTPSSPEEVRRTKAITNGILEGDEEVAVDKPPVESPQKRDPEADRLPMSEGLFKSPIIIVALTASSLQSDRHEALAAGCNDFLTKPVHLPWLERKVKEWGCMQALIDFDGWRRWREYNEKEEAGKSEEEKRKEREQAEKHRKKMEKLNMLQEKRKKEEEEKKKKAHRASMDVQAGEKLGTGTNNAGLVASEAG